jgi:mRNA interferase MazF
MFRGEIWSVNLDPTIGSEIRKTRPAVIVSRDSIGILPLKIVVPITGWRDEFSQAPWLVPLERDPQTGLVKKSAADALQVRSVSQERLVERLGQLDNGSMERIGAALALTLDIENL